MLQSGRVAAARGISQSNMQKLIDSNTDTDFIGIWGHPGVNVLALNMALDKLNNKEQAK
jgi:K+-transporting ATPase ATPase C chain